MSKQVEAKVTFFPQAKADHQEQSRDQILMDRICKITKNWWSPLCNDWELYNKWKAIFESKGVSRDIALWIMYAESHIGANYAGTCDKSWHNRWGIKWRITDQWVAIRDQQIPNNWCWLYKFDSVQDYFNSKANTLVKYKSCFSQKKPITCISYKYVWDPNVAEQSWINNVSVIAY